MELTFVKFYAQQGPQPAREQKVSLGFAYRGRKTKRKKSTTDQAVKPDVLEEGEVLVEKFETAKVFTFTQTKDGFIVLDDQIYGRWGVLHKAFFEIWGSLRKAPYIVEMLKLMRVENPNGEPVKIKPKHKFGDNEPENPFSLPVPRSRGTTRQLEYFDYIENREGIPARIVLPSELPMSEEEFKTLVHGLEFITLHPLRRGIVKVVKVIPRQNCWQNA